MHAALCRHHAALLGSWSRPAPLRLAQQNAHGWLRQFEPMKRFLIIVVIIVVLLYAGDFLSLRLGLPKRDMVGSVTVHTYYSVKLKNGKTEYDYAGDHDVNCANSLFPQLGLKPCWYLIRHTNEQITIDSGNPNNPHLF